MLKLESKEDSIHILTAVTQVHSDGREEDDDRENCIMRSIGSRTCRQNTVKAKIKVFWDA